MTIVQYFEQDFIIEIHLGSLYLLIRLHLGRLLAPDHFQPGHWFDCLISYLND